MKPMQTFVTFISCCSGRKQISKEAEKAVCEKIAEIVIKKVAVKKRVGSTVDRLKAL